MKPDSNIEIDRLLHRFARQTRDGSMPIERRDGASSVNAAPEQTSGTGHLDADELIAYAENALPVATRTRYTGHISECDSCRKQVTDLVLSSGLAAQLEAQAPTKVLAQTTSWRDWLAAMFAPRVLRYAATVLLVAGITAIGVIVFRGREPRFSIAPTRSENGSANENAGEPSSRNDGLAKDKNSGVQSPSSIVEEGSKPDAVNEAPARALKDAPQDGPAEAQKSGQEQTEAKPAPPVTTGVLSGGRAATRDEDFSADADRQPTYGEDSVAKRKVNKEVDREESAGQVASERRSRAQADESYSPDGANASKSSTVAATNSRPAAKSSARRGTEPSPASSAQSTPTDDRKAEANVADKAEGARSVSGRQFVRRNGAWVDVAYRSQATTNVKRGSDQYRALVADEPGLRAVANQLGGDVIVVWKGRAYRIH